MRIDGEDGWLELIARDDAEAFDVRCLVGDFSGRNPRIWIGANELRGFLESLCALESDRRGEARMAAMSPDEFELAVRVIDCLGHVSVEGTVGRLQHRAHRADRLLIKFSFTLDPTSLPKLVRDVTALATCR